MRFLPRGTKQPKDKGAATVARLRQSLFELDPADLRLAPSADCPTVWGVLMETGYEEASATLVAIGDGTVSLYFSNGGGIIGCGGHASVRAAGARFLAVAQEQLHDFEPSVVLPLPAVGTVRFYALTFDGLRTATDNERRLGSHEAPLSRLFFSAQAVITAIRERGLM